MLTSFVHAADGGWPDEPDTRVVNEGRLEFLATPPPEAVHEHDNRLTITERSLRDGYVRLEQCHRHLDPVPSTQIVFGQNRMRGLTITRAEGIGRAWVEDASVQLADVGRAAILCLRGESRVLTREGSGYVLRNGPYMRGFLDGYYPMHVRLVVEHPAHFRLDSLTPAPRPGLRLNVRPGHVEVETWFNGRLTTEMRFLPENSDVR